MNTGKKDRPLRNAVIGVTLIGSWVLTLPVSLYLVVEMFANKGFDTTTLSNAAFAVLMLAANVTFSYSRALDEREENKRKVVHAGEDFFLSAMVFAAASLLKYGTLKCLEGPAIFVAAEDRKAYSDVGGFLAACAFVIAVIIAYLGVIGVSWFLLNRRDTRIHQSTKSE